MQKFVLLLLFCTLYFYIYTFRTLRTAVTSLSFESSRETASGASRREELLRGLLFLELQIRCLVLNADETSNVHMYKYGMCTERVFCSRLKIIRTF